MAETDAVGLVRKYLMEVAVQWKTGQATEHSYRPALKTLLEGLLPKVIVINEPQHIACGAPDYILRDRRTALHLGFIEAKDVGDGDLDGNGVHKEQFNRYRNSLESLVTGNMFDLRAQFPVEGDNRVSQAKFADARVFINDVQYFDNVPEAAWNFFIGGYQPTQKWLKDRKGRVLSADDILHYKSIILALLETVRLMDAKISPKSKNTT